MPLPSRVLSTLKQVREINMYIALAVEQINKGRTPGHQGEAHMPREATHTAFPESILEIERRLQGRCKPEPAHLLERASRSLSRKHDGPQP